MLKGKGKTDREGLGEREGAGNFYLWTGGRGWKGVAGFRFWIWNGLVGTPREVGWVLSLLPVPREGS